MVDGGGPVHRGPAGAGVNDDNYWTARIAIMVVAASTLTAILSLTYVLFHVDNEIALTTMQNVAMAGLGYMASEIKRRT